MAVLLVANLVVIDYWLFVRPQDVTPPVVNCPSVCPQPTLSSQDTPTPTSTSTTAYSPTSSPVTKSTTYSYVPIPGDGSILSSTWTDVPGTDFEFDPKNFSGFVEARLNANLRLYNGNGTAYLRLFDVTAGIEVWGSEVKATGQNFTYLTSAKLQLRPGNRKYRIQLKSETADTAVFNSGQLRLLIRN